jgi:hypothetical protein
MKFQHVILIAVIALILLMYFDPFHRFDPEQTIVRSDTTIIRLPDITVSVPPGKPSIVTVNIPQVVDTGAIIQDYYATKQYHDSVETDSVKIYIFETLRENSIIDRKLTTQFKFTTSNIQTYVEAKKRNKLYLGGAINYSDRFGVALVGAVVNRRDQMIVGGYDPFTKTIQGGVMVKIGMRR